MYDTSSYASFVALIFFFGVWQSNSDTAVASMRMTCAESLPCFGVPNT